MRKHFIDNLRIFCILLLFPYHTGMIFNNFGQAFYVHGQALDGFTLIAALIYPWWMTLLFTIAGISTAYALKKRSIKEYAKERINKLLIPVVVGIIAIIPVQSYIADVFHNNYSGGYFEHYKVFFTKFTDLTGYDGGFTPAHLWFMLFLFVVSMIMVPAMSYYNKCKRIDGSKIGLKHILPMFLVILIMTPILDFGGRSIGEALACFTIGYFILSLYEVQELLNKKCLLLAGLFAVMLCVHGILYENGIQSGIVWDIEYRIVLWIGIIALLGLAKRYFNKTNKVLMYLSQASFPIYYFHQTILVIVGFIVLKLIDIVFVQYIVIMISTFIASIVCYEICRRFKVTCALFGIKYIQKDLKGSK